MMTNNIVSSIWIGTHFAGIVAKKNILNLLKVKKKEKIIRISINYTNKILFVCLSYHLFARLSRGVIKNSMSEYIELFVNGINIIDRY